MTKVSIIIPLFNKSKYISMTLDSILQQKFADYEVLIINDGSTDNSLEIVTNYAKRDNRFFVIDIPNNGGVSNARNIGLSNAKGDWIQFLDGDDRIDRDYLAIGIELAEKFDVDILFTNFQMVNGDGTCIRRVSGIHEGLCGQKELCQYFIEEQYENGFFGYISNKLIRRTVLEKSKAKFPVDIKLAEDLDFYSQVYPDVRKAFFSDVESFYYLQTDENYLSNEKIDYYSQLIVQLDIRNWFVKSGYYLEYQKLLDNRVGEYVFFSLFYEMENIRDIRELFQKIVDDDEILGCIHPEYFNGLKKMLLRAAKNKNYYAVKGLLYCRMAIRNVYRRIKNE